MTRFVVGEYMSKKNSSSTILPPLQRRVILCLAQEGLQTINEVVKNIPRLELAPASHYKPTWLAIKSLTEKGYIQAIGAKEYRGRQYPLYWLTGNGILLAFMEGTRLTHLLTETQRIYPDNITLACYLEIASKLDPNIFRTAFSALDKKGKIEPTSKKISREGKE